MACRYLKSLYCNTIAHSMLCCANIIITNLLVGHDITRDIYSVIFKSAMGKGDSLAGNWLPSSKSVRIWSSSHLTSSLLSPGPPALSNHQNVFYKIGRTIKTYQWPQIDGNAKHLPMPGDMLCTSYSESSGGKYRSVLPGRTRVFALILLMASSKSESSQL